MSQDFAGTLLGSTYSALYEISLQCRVANYKDEIM